MLSWQLNQRWLQSNQALFLRPWWGFLAQNTSIVSSWLLFVVWFFLASLKLVVTKAEECFNWAYKSLYFACLFLINRFSSAKGVNFTWVRSYSLAHWFLQHMRIFNFDIFCFSMHFSCVSSIVLSWNWRIITHSLTGSSEHFLAQLHDYRYLTSMSEYFVDFIWVTLLRLNTFADRCLAARSFSDIFVQGH